MSAEQVTAFFLVQCCECGRMQTPLGWRQQFTLAMHSGGLISHSLCPTCLQEATEKMEMELHSVELQMAR